MAELYRHTDEDGRSLTVAALWGCCSTPDDDLLVWTGRDGVAHGDRAIHLSQVDGRRLLDALVNHYGSKDSIEEEARRA